MGGYQPWYRAQEEWHPVPFHRLLDSPATKGLLRQRADLSLSELGWPFPFALILVDSDVLFAVQVAGKTRQKYSELAVSAQRTSGDTSLSPIRQHFLALLS